VIHLCRSRRGSGTWVGFLLDPCQAEVVGVSDFADELAVLFALFLFLRLALLAVFFGFVLALFNHLLDFLFFFLRVLVGERLVVFRDQAFDGLAVEFHDLGGLGFGGLYLAFVVEFVFFLALDVGVVALSFVVFHVLLRSLANELADLVLGKGWGGDSSRGRVLAEGEAACQNKDVRGLDSHIHAT
jgi:hypothetical protein